MTEIGAQIQQIIESHGDAFSGACLLKWRGRTLYKAARGLASKEYDIPNTLDTRFDTASVTKVYTAIATLQLVEEGRLWLDARPVDILNLTGTKIPADVTVEHLLNHTSGIADDADEEAGEKYEDLFVDKPNYAIRENAHLLPGFVYKEPLFRAGEDMRYNNCAFVLLGLIIERITGRHYREYVTEEIFRRGGLAHTAFYAKDEVNPGLAEGYFARRDGEGNFLGWRKNIYSFPPVGTGDSGAYTTVGDLCALILALREGLLLSPIYTDLLFQPHCGHSRPHRHGERRTGYGFEFLLQGDKLLCMYKEGSNPGVDAIVAYFPETELTLAMLANQEGPFWEIYRGVQDLLLEDILDAGS